MKTEDEIVREVWVDTLDLTPKKAKGMTTGDLAEKFADTTDGDLNIITRMMQQAVRKTRESMKADLRKQAEVNALGQYLSNAENFDSIDTLNGLSEEDWNEKVSVWQPFEDYPRSEVESLIYDYYTFALQNIEEL